MNYVDVRPASNYKKGWDNPVDKDKFLDSINKTKQTTCQNKQQLH